MRVSVLVLALVAAAASAQNNFTSRQIPISSNRLTMGPAMTPDGTIGYVGDQGTNPNVMWELDLNGGSVIRSFGAGSVGLPAGCAVVEGRLYAQAVNQVVIFDRLTGNVVTTIPTPQGGGIVMGEVLYRPSVQRAYALIGNGTSVQIIDTTNDSLIRNQIHGGTESPGLGVDAIGQFGYVADRILGNLRTIDLVNNTPVGTVSYIGMNTINAYGPQVTVDTFRNIVYVEYVDGNFQGAIAEMSAGNTLTRTIALSGFTNGLALTPNMKYLLTGNGRVVDAIHGTVVGTIPGGGSGEYRGAASNDSNRALFTNYNSSFATLFEGLATFLTSTSPARIGNPAGYRLAVPGDAGLVYCAAASLGSSPGIPFPDGRVLPLQPDALFLVSACANNAIFSGFIGVLDANGVANFAVNIPNIGGLVGIPYSVAAVTTDVTAPSGFSIVSNAVTQTIAP
jgi:hypothetical protein